MSEKTWMDELRNRLQELGVSQPWEVNTWDYVDKIRPWMESFDHSDPITLGLNLQYQAVLDEIGDHMWEEDFGVRPSSATAATPMEAIGRYYDHGFIPPPVLLRIHSLSFELYRIAGGAWTLDQICFPPPKQNSGHRLKQQQMDDLCLAFHFQNTSRLTDNAIRPRLRLTRARVAQRARRGSISKGYLLPTSEEKLAEQFVDDHNLKVKPKSFRESYRRWRRKNGL